MLTLFLFIYLFPVAKQSTPYASSSTLNKTVTANFKQELVYESTLIEQQCKRSDSSSQIRPIIQSLSHTHINVTIPNARSSYSNIELNMRDEPRA